MIIGENILFGIAFYAAILWSVQLVITVTFVVTLIYGATYYDRSETTGSRAWRALRRCSWWGRCRRFYRHEVRTADFDASGRADVPCLFAASPHGVNAASFFFSFIALTEEMQTRLGGKAIECGIWNLFFWFPILREIVLALGCVNVRWHTIESALRVRGSHFALIPGGVYEIAPAVPPPPRTGFLKLAYSLQDRADCAFVYLENEAKVYSTWGDRWRFRQWALALIGVPITFYFGPRPTHPLRVWIGARHVYREGESYVEYEARWFKAVGELKARVDAAAGAEQSLADGKKET